jgi:hypothetical protein
MKDKKSEGAIAIIEAHKRGYRVLDDGSLQNPYGRILKQIAVIKPYNYVLIKFNINIHGKHYSIPIARLAAYQKYGEKVFLDGIQTRHLNGDSTDNSLSNIAIGTAKDNAQDKPSEVHKRTSKIAAMARRKFNDNEIRIIRKLRVEGYKYSQLIKIFNCAKSTISGIINKKFYKDVSDGV